MYKSLIIRLSKGEITRHRKEGKMTKYTAIFKNGEVVKTSEEFASRLDFYNWVCMNRLGKKYDKLIEIRMTIIPA